jgi:DNA mismatch repair protein MLH1
MTELLVSKAPMLVEYFGIEITSLGCLAKLPILLDNYIPSLMKLPMFLFHLATRVDWTTERTCFQNIAAELGLFYAIEPPEEDAEAVSASQMASSSTNSNINTTNSKKYPVIFK